MKTKLSAAYRLGFKKAGEPHYWTHLYNSQLDKFPTLALKVDFHNGYHDGLADRYKLARPAHVKAEDLKDHYGLYLYN